MSCNHSLLTINKDKAYVGDKLILYRNVIFSFLIIKILIMLWNMGIYPLKEQYDFGMHFARVATAGIEASPRYYNPPLYYMLGFPLLFFKDSASLTFAYLYVFKFINIIMIFLFYCLWIFKIFPRLIRDPLLWFSASAFLLALPGYQKAGVMVHPDNLLILMVTFLFIIWFKLKEKAGPLSRVDAVGAGLCLGATMLVRPFAAAPCLVFGLAYVWLFLFRQGQGDRFREVALKVILVAIVSLTLGVSWWVYRYAQTGVFLEHDFGEYAAKYSPLRENYDFGHYFTATHFKSLLEQPNRHYAQVKMKELKPDDKTKNDSFITLAYSDFWADHWLYFSGPKLKDNKVWFKRVLLTFAMPISVIVILGYWFEFIYRVLKKLYSPDFLILFTVSMLGFIQFLYWNTHTGLFPQNNTAVKVIYNLYYLPFGVVIAMWGLSRFPWRKYFPWVFGGIYVLSLPIATYTSLHFLEAIYGAYVSTQSIGQFAGKLQELL